MHEPAYVVAFKAAMDAGDNFTLAMQEGRREDAMLAAVSALAHYRKAVRLSAGEEKAMCLGLAAGWANVTNQPTLALELLDEGCALAEEDSDTSRHLRGLRLDLIKARRMKIKVAPRG